MKKAGFITALVAVILDTLITVFTVNFVSQFSTEVAVRLLIVTGLMLAPMIAALFLVNKNKLWAISFIVVGAISFVLNVSNGNTLIPLLPTAEIIAGILILVSKELPNKGENTNDQPKQ
jgi:hypothetical protein